ncbi:hypothetical protein, partial [Klebsiella pneumoniae]|uniref:hypothetical protein n=1 Tax=Klebsiella pneumoniae TaxID=573 RepID=UPI003B5A75CC
DDALQRVEIAKSKGDKAQNQNRGGGQRGAPDRKNNSSRPPSKKKCSKREPKHISQRDKK